VAVVALSAMGDGCKAGSGAGDEGLGEGSIERVESSQEKESAHVAS
jgi:hypothetical protein